MLISHRKKFIFTKTSKTAGSSVETFFEQYCMPEGEWEFSESRSQYINNISGIIGSRGTSHPKSDLWYNHMPAKLIKSQIGEDIWNSYYKFCTVRNPFDKLISAFHFSVNNNYQKKSIKNKLATYFKLNPTINLRGKNDYERFKDWIKKGGKLIDRDKYLVNGQVEMDYFIRFENLKDDIQYICKKLEIPFDSSKLLHLKKNNTSKRKIQDYYDDECINIVTALYKFEIEYFGYDCL